LTRHLPLAAAVVADVAAASTLARSAGFTGLDPSMVVTVRYGAAFYLLSLVAWK
jgi:multidrug transporter EmrE-like cation transporter